MRLLYIVLIISSVAAEKLSDKPKGWLWYTPQPTVLVKPQPKQSAETPTTQLKKLQKRFAELKAKAVLNPTYNNVQQLFLIQAQMIQQASKFQQMYQLVSLAQPPMLEDNPNPAYQQQLKQQQLQQVQHKLRRLSQSYGLFFVYKSDCPYCHQFAPTVQRFAKVYGFKVKAISADGQGIAQFPDAVPDNGAIFRINPEGIFPALFLANPQTGLVVPLSWGMSSWSGLHDNAQVVITALEGQRHA